MTDTPNAQQAVYWNEAAGPTWAELQAPLDRQLAPLGRAGMAAKAPLLQMPMSPSRVWTLMQD